MSNRSRRPASEWESLVQSFEQSDQNITDFCQDRGINKHSLNYWRAKQRSSCTSSAPGFISLRPKGNATDSIVVRCPGGLEVALPVDYPPASLVQLIQGLSC